jgi:hypothetical protein
MLNSAPEQTAYDACSSFPGSGISSATSSAVAAEACALPKAVPPSGHAADAGAAAAAAFNAAAAAGAVVPLLLPPLLLLLLLLRTSGCDMRRHCRAPHCTAAHTAKQSQQHLPPHW